MSASVLRVPVTLSIPASCPGLFDGWWPSPIHQHALLALLQGLSAAEHAQQQRRGIGTVREHRRSCRLRASVATERALAHASISRGLITVEHIPQAGLVDLPPEVVKVWPHLAYDVPERNLDAHIAAQTRLSTDDVTSALSLLRSEGEDDCALIARGYACGVLTGHETTQRQLPTAHTVEAQGPPLTGIGRLHAGL
ncbi:hypothetical protein [Streptomyces sp. NPDC002403]